MKIYRVGMTVILFLLVAMIFVVDDCAFAQKKSGIDFGIVAQEYVCEGDTSYAKQFQAANPYSVFEPFPDDFVSGFSGDCLTAAQSSITGNAYWWEELDSCYYYETHNIFTKQSRFRSYRMNGGICSPSSSSLCQLPEISWAGVVAANVSGEIFGEGTYNLPKNSIEVAVGLSYVGYSSEEIVEITEIGFSAFGSGTRIAFSTNDHQTFSAGEHNWILLESQYQDIILRAYATNCCGTTYSESFSFDQPFWSNEDVRAVCLFWFEPTHNFGSPVYEVEDRFVNIAPPMLPLGSGTKNNIHYQLADDIGSMPVSYWYEGFYGEGYEDEEDWIYGKPIPVGSFYPREGADFIGIPPAQPNMFIGCDCSGLPVYDIFDEAALSIGVEVCLLYVLATLSIAMGLGFLAYLLIGNLLIAVVVMLGVMSAFFSTGAMPFWVLLIFGMMSISTMYIARRV